MEMASIDEMMSHKNKEPKWMTEEIGGKGNNKSKSNNKADNKESSTPSKPKTPAVPKTDFKVKMCCQKCEEIAKEEAGEVDGVISVITDASKSRVTVTGFTDAAAVLKKLKKKVNSKAAYWPQDLPNSKKHVTFKEESGESGGKGDKGDNVKSQKAETGKGENRKGEQGESTNNMEQGEAKKANKKGGNNSKDLQGTLPSFEYMSIDPRGFQPVDPWARGGGYGPQSHVDPIERLQGGYQPKPSYFSNYRPSQSYPANYRSTDEYSNQPITNPEYIKQIYY
ncbi:unnamed protein product [Sphagnum jensenii]|uniref:HMA domain-containing protein n=1 Tax=Sphagnum jensenii TaxID=128206 RepID=A0ABP0VUG1_9BRYO